VRSLSTRLYLLAKFPQKEKLKVENQKIEGILEVFIPEAGKK
jgi:hypothetical protein